MKKKHSLFLILLLITAQTSVAKSENPIITFEKSSITFDDNFSCPKVPTATYSYTDEGWIDTAGNPIAQPFVKSDETMNILADFNGEIQGEDIRSTFYVGPGVTFKGSLPKFVGATVILHGALEQTLPKPIDNSEIYVCSSGRMVFDYDGYSMDSGNRFYNAGTITFTGNLNMNPGVEFTNYSGAILNVEGVSAAFSFQVNGTLVNYGKIYVNNGNMYMNSSATVSNYCTIYAKKDIIVDNQLINSGLLLVDGRLELDAGRILNSGIADFGSLLIDDSAGSGATFTGQGAHSLIIVRRDAIIRNGGEVAQTKFYDVDDGGGFDTICENCKADIEILPELAIPDLDTYIEYCGAAINIPSGLLSGRIYNDSNVNGQQDTGERGLAGIRVRVTDKSGVTTNFNTDVNGDWITTKLPAGEAVVWVAARTLPAGAVRTEGVNRRTITIIQDISTVEESRGYSIPDGQGEVKGRVYFDANGNGTQDAGEPGREGLGIVITNENGDWIGARTNAKGDWVASTGGTKASVRIGDVDFQQEAVLTEGGWNIQDVIVTAGGSIDVGNIGYVTNQISGTLKGMIYKDTNGNGTQDTGESGLGNVAVLVSDVHHTLKTVTTDNTGNWIANDIVASDTKVTVDRSTLPLGSALTQGIDTNRLVTVGAKTTLDTGKIGYTSVPETAMISGLVYEDVNGNGVQDNGETGIENVEINVTSGDGYTRFAYTNVEGNWTISAVPVGLATVSIAEASIRLGATLTQGTRTTSIAVLANANTNAGIIGYVLPDEIGKLSGRVYHDSNGNGTQDIGEPGIENAWVFIASEGKTRADVYTDSNGDWIASLVVSRAEISVAGASLPLGVLQTEYYSDSVAMAPGVTTSVGSAGYSGAVVVAPLSGLIYQDSNGNGVQDADELGMANVSVNIAPESGMPQVVSTGADGRWFFDAVPVGVVVVDIDNTTLPLGATQTAGNDPSYITTEANVNNTSSIDGYAIYVGKLIGQVYDDFNGNGIMDTDEFGLEAIKITITDSEGERQTVTTSAEGTWSVEVIPGAATVAIDTSSLPKEATLTQGVETRIVDVLVDGNSNAGMLGYTNVPQMGFVYGLVYDDSNGNGTQDEGELGIGSIAIEITDAEGVTQTVMTNETYGNWSADVLSGAVTVNVDTAGLPADAFLTQGTMPNTILVAGIRDGETNVGSYGYTTLPQTGFLYGRIYDDSNGNGTQDEAELGLGSVSVDITDAEGTVRTVITAENSGDWISGDLIAGSTTVTIDTNTLPKNVMLTAGSDPNVITVSAYTQIDAGAVGYAPRPLGMLSGLIYDDRNGNGVQEPNEVGLDSVFISILGAEGSIETVTTRSDGSWSLSLPAGIVTVDIDNTSLPVGAVLTAGALDSKELIIVAYDTTDAGDIGYVIPLKPGTLSGFVYFDENGNGVQDGKESGMANIAIAIQDSKEEVQTVITSAAGEWNAIVLEGVTLITVDRSTLPLGVALSEGGDPSLVLVTANSDTDAGVLGYAVPPETGTLSGVVYRDSDGNGDQDSTDPGLANVVVSITDSNGGTQTTTTDGNGNWTATLLTGEAVVDIDDATLPEGASQTEGTDPSVVNVVANTTANAGSDGFEIIVTVSNDDIVVYEAISPNGDGINDELVITGISTFPYTELIIFNRWSQLVYSTTNYGKDGNVFRGYGNNQEVLPSGTYMYIFKYQTNNQSEGTKSGHLYLQR